MTLTAVQGSMSLASGTAQAWFAFCEAAVERYGFTPWISAPGGAWRSEAMVLDMWLNPAKYGATKGVAKPRSLGGPGSVHENGRCVDINNWAVLGSKLLEPLASQFGFTRTIAKEPWHFQHDGSTAVGGSGSGGSGTPSPVLEEDDMTTMILLYNAATSSHGVRRAVGVVGSKFIEGLTDTNATSVGNIIKWQRKLPNDTDQSTVTINVDDRGYELVRDLCTPAASSGDAAQIPSGLATKADVEAVGAKTTTDVKAAIPTTFKAS